MKGGRPRDYNAVPIRGTVAHTFTWLYYHMVFGTRFRRPLEWKPLLEKHGINPKAR